MLFNQHLLAVEIDTGFHSAEAESLKILLGHKEQGIDCQRRINTEMQTHPGIVKGVADELVKLGVLLVLDLVLVSGPQGLDRIDLFTANLYGKRYKI